jgi:hypothetical protein
MRAILTDEEHKDYKKYMEEADQKRQERARMGLPLSSEYEDGSDEDENEADGEEDEDDLFEEGAKEKSTSEENDESVSSG